MFEGQDGVEKRADHIRAEQPPKPTFIRLWRTSRLQRYAFTTVLIKVRRMRGHHMPIDLAQFVPVPGDQGDHERHQAERDDQPEP